jgi:GNAT superfamily N-acetyltransferase
MKPSDIDFATACTCAEGWAGQTRLVFDDFLAHDPKGCFIAEVKGQRAGICVATAYKQHGFIGMLIVTMDYRGHGLGTALFTHSVGYLSNRGIGSIALDADPLGIPIYEKAGFRKVCRSLRFNGNILGESHPPIQPMLPYDFRAVCTKDEELFGDDRSFFLRRKYERNPERCFVAKEDDALLGYLLADTGDKVISVGPWAVCPELSRPLALLQQLALVIPGKRMRIGVLESNKPVATLLRAMPGLVESEPSWRMVLGKEDIPNRSQWLYAIGSPAKG